MKSPRVLGIIPARGGSKGIPGKNIKLLAGKPLIAHSIASAKEARLLTKVIVSTDSRDIAVVAKEFGAEVPFVRPAEFATDKAVSIDVVKHALEFFADQGETFDIVILLQPTCPMRRGEDIDRAVKMIEETGCDSVVSLVDVGANHPARMYHLHGDKPVGIIEAKEAMRPRQELAPVYIRSGDIYAAKVSAVLEQNSLMPGDGRGLIIPMDETVNIDGPMDLEIAEIRLRSRS